VVPRHFFSQSASVLNVANDSFIALPRADFILLQLHSPVQCLTCTGQFAEFERAAGGMTNNKGCSSIGAKSFLCILSVNCARFGSLCRRYRGPHREPFSSVVHEEPNHFEHPPRGWMRSWPTSTVILGQRSDMLKITVGPQAYWRLDIYESAEDILSWVQSKLRLCFKAPQHSEVQLHQISQLHVLPRGVFRERILTHSNLLGHMTDNGCLCQQFWMYCTGGFLGQWQSCAKMENCPKHKGMCRTVAPCGDTRFDTCNSRPGQDSVIGFPALHAHKVDAELAAAAWLSLIWDSAVFFPSGRTGQGLSTRGLKRRKVLLNFLRLLCKFFPHDRDKKGQLIIREALGAVLGSAHAAAERGRRLWWWQPDGPPKNLECRKSLCKLRTLLQRKWRYFARRTQDGQAFKINAVRLHRAWQICRRPWYTWASEEWQQCRGSFIGTRQLPCGIWVLLHTVLGQAATTAANDQNRVVDVDSIADHKPLLSKPNYIATAIRTFLLEFLDCPVCVRHLLRAPFDEGGMATFKDAVLWLWETHNYISQAIASKPHDERAFATDPAFPAPKAWPPRTLCPTCSQVTTQGVNLSGRADVQNFDVANCKQETCLEIDSFWDREAVYRFLVGFYTQGGTQLNLHSESKEEVGDFTLDVEGRIATRPSFHKSQLSDAQSLMTCVWALFAASIVVAIWVCQRPSVGESYRLVNGGRRRVQPDSVPHSEETQTLLHAS